MNTEPPALTRRHYSFFNIAKKIARLSDSKNFKFGVIITRNSKVVSYGVNSLKSHPRSKTPGQLTHAEFCAIINAREDIRGCDIYVWRSGARERPLLAKPCAICAALIRSSGLRNVFYTSENSFNMEPVCA